MPFSPSRGIMYTAPPTEKDRDEKANASKNADTTATPAPADD